MLKRRLRRGLVPVLAVVAVFWSIVPAEADVPPPSRVVSNYETATGLVLHRDAGVSVPLPPMPGQPAGQSRSLWIFGDTFQSDAAGNPVPPALPFWPGTFGAIGPYTPGQVPTSLSHLSPGGTLTIPNNNAPSLLVANPSGLKLPDGTPCSGAAATYKPLYQAAWTLGATLDSSNQVLMSVFDTCVYESASPQPCSAFGGAWDAWAPVRWSVQRTKLVRYQPSNNTITSTLTPFQTADGSCLPWQQILTMPAFHGGYLYMYGQLCESFAAPYAACLSGKVTAARVPAGQLGSAAAYQWATASGGWSSNHQDAATVLPSTPSHLGPIAVDVHDFSSVGEGYLMLEQTTLGGHYNIYQAGGPAGPWVLKQSSRVAGCRTGNGEGCYALMGHPELSTPGHLMYTYVNKSEGFVTVTDIGPIP